MRKPKHRPGQILAAPGQPQSPRIPVPSELECEAEAQLPAIMGPDGRRHEWLRPAQIRAVWPEAADAIIAGAQAIADLAALDARLAALRADRAEPLTAITLAREVGDTPDPADVAALTAIAAEIKTLAGQRDALTAVASPYQPDE